MKKNILSVFILVTMLLASFSNTFAHHSGAPYDREAEVIIEGIVEEWRWSNPHAWLRLKTIGEDGEVVVWNFEATSPNILLRQGWRRSSIKQGDRIKVIAAPLRDGNPGGNLLGVELENGTVLGAPSGAG